jgi:hypothetical protein
MQRRVDMDRLQELVRLHRMGSGGREVARLLGMSRTPRGRTESCSRRRGCWRGRGPADAGGAESGGPGAPAAKARSAAEVVARDLAREDRGALEEGRRSARDLRHAPARARAVPRGARDPLRGEARLRAAQACPGRAARGRRDSPWRRGPARSRRSTSATSAGCTTRAPA